MTQAESNSIIIGSWGRSFNGKNTEELGRIQKNWEERFSNSKVLDDPDR
jgi:hypothetical protein